MMKSQNLKKSLSALASVAGLALTITSFQNCGAAGFDVIDSMEKQNFLSKNSVFGGLNGFLSSKSSLNNDSVNTVIQVANDNTGVDLPIQYYCTSHGYTGLTGILYTNELHLEVSKNGQVLCDEKDNQYSDIVDYKKVKIMNSCLSQLTAGEKYKVRIYDPKTPANTMGAKDGAFKTSGDDFVFDGKELKLTSGTFMVLYDDDPKVKTTASAKICDRIVSPLVVILGKGSQRIELTPPTKGIYYDILGQKSDPAPHTKKKISWFLNTNHNYYFISLPDSQGRVTGIDQLFGDSTYGPDGQFAENGYLALAKHDSDQDGYITSKDPVFHQLRLWHDTNLDGVSTPEELFTLDEMGVVAIDLNYDKNYKEEDIYGNKILMKSVVKTKDGKLHLLFDLWFRYLN